MSFPRYPEYKDSGGEWLGRVPAHWRVQRLKNSIVSCKNGIWGAEPNGDEGDIECVRVADFDRTRLLVNAEVPTLRSVSETERDGRLLRRGDLLLEKSGGGEKQPVGQVVMYDRNLAAVCSNFVAKVELQPQMDSRFWTYQHAALYSAGVNVRSIKQTSGIQNLDQSAYFNEFGVFPPPNEQSAIAAFLDRETAKIDALIAEQEKLIALLAEKRQATISHAVTKGLDPDVPMKDSGVPWLGEVPEHWRLPPMYLRYRVELGKMLDARRITGNHLIPYLRNVDVQWDAINYDDLPLMDIQPSEYDRYTVKHGDLLVCEGGEVGRAALVLLDDAVVGFQKALHRLRVTSDQEYPRYLFYTFAYASRAGAFAGEGQSTIAHLTGEQLRKYRFPSPPLQEQIAIAEFLDSEMSKLATLSDEATRAVALLSERRSALIAAAVTGQIDVRGKP